MQNMQCIRGVALYKAVHFHSCIIEKLNFVMAKPFVDSGKSGESSAEDVRVEYSAGKIKCYVVFLALLVIFGITMMSHAVIGFTFSDGAAEISINCEINFKLVIAGVWKIDLRNLLHLLQ